MSLREWVLFGFEVLGVWVVMGLVVVGIINAYKWWAKQQ